MPTHAPEDPEALCDFCRLPCPESPVTLDRDGTTYTFCTRACRAAMEASDRVFTAYHGHRRFSPGVAALDEQLPQGLPRNTFVLLSGQAGTRDEAVQAELVWRTLQRGESAVIVAFTEPPLSVVEEFLLLNWNVLPYIERGQLQVVDCFTYRLEERGSLLEHLSEWNAHLQSVIEPATTAVRDPSDIREVKNKLDNVLDERGMVDSGVVVVDSLTEFGTLVQPVQAYDFVKDVRADVCKGRFVTTFAGATYAGQADAFPHDLSYVVDGVVDMELNESIVEDTLIKRLRIRKMSGVLAIAEWTAYEYTSETGMVTFDPVAQQTEARADRESDADPGRDPSGGSSDGGDDARTTPPAADPASDPPAPDGTPVGAPDGDDGSGTDTDG